MGTSAGTMRRMLTAGLLILLVLLGGCAGWLYTPDRPRAALEARWAQAPSRFVEVAGLRVHLRDTGPRDGRPILFLHGFASSLHTWDEVAARLEADHRVIRFDLPGFGLTGPDPTGDYGDARSHAVIAAVMEALGVPRASLVGSSMGGRIAWSFAASQPARVDRLVLMAPDGFASPGFEYGRAPRMPFAMRLLPYTLPRFMLEGGLRPVYGDPAVLTPALVDRYEAMMLAPGVRRAIIDRMGQHVLQPPEPLLARITAPTLLIWGERDRMVLPANAADYLRALPNARAVELPGIGHVPMEEAPEEVARLIRDFVATP